MSMCEVTVSRSVIINKCSLHKGVYKPHFTAECEQKPVYKVAKKRSTSTAVGGGGEKNPPSSSAAAAAVMKKKKNKKKKKNNNNNNNNNNNKGDQEKCNICLNQYHTQNLDKHMHSRSHHEAIERLTGGKQLHRCWACDVSVPGLDEFSKHIETKEHNNKLVSLKQHTERGFTVDYNDNGLNALCVRRDQHRVLLKRQKQEEKLKRLKERKAAMYREAFNQKLQMKDKDWSTRAKSFNPPGSHRDSRSFTYPLSNERKRGMMNAGPALQAVHNKGDKTLGWNNFYWQTSKSITWSMKEDVDFTSDRLSPAERFPFSEKRESQQSQYTSRDQDKVTPDQERSCDVHTSDSPPMKKQCLRDGPSMKARFTSSVRGDKVESERLIQSASAATPPPAPGLVQSQVDRLSMMLKNIRKSLEEEHLTVGSSDDPESKLTPVSGARLKRNEHGKETELSDIPPKSDMQACKTKRKSSPCQQVNTSPASSADPQEKTEATQPKRVLPTLLSLSVGKTEASKPNLKVARGIRRSQKPSRGTEARALKPALQKLISSKSSQWRFNWKEIYQEATQRRLQREKGMPRFGIELVTPLPPDPQGPEAEDLAHFELDEGFQWASVECDAVTPPCSVSRSSEDVHRFPPAEAYPAETRDCGKTAETTNCTSWSAEHKQRDIGENPNTSGMSRSSALTSLDSLVCVKTEKSDDRPTETMQEKAALSVPVMQIKLKTQDYANTGALNKDPPKSQVNELLVMSLREDKLCRSLEDVDGHLLRAQTALQSAFMEVQRLQIIKQQVTAEMSSLRSKRIDILQRIKNSRLDQTPDADSPGSAVQTPQRAAGTSIQHRDTPPWDVSSHRHDQRRTDLSLALESRKAHDELSKSTVPPLRHHGAEAQPNTSL